MPYLQLCLITCHRLSVCIMCIATASSTRGATCVASSRVSDSVSKHTLRLSAAATKSVWSCTRPLSAGSADSATATLLKQLHRGSRTESPMKSSSVSPPDSLRCRTAAPIYCCATSGLHLGDHNDCHFSSSSSTHPMGSSRSMRSAALATFSSIFKETLRGERVYLAASDCVRNRDVNSPTRKLS